MYQSGTPGHVITDNKKESAKDFGHLLAELGTEHNSILEPHLNDNGAVFNKVIQRDSLDWVQGQAKHLGRCCYELLGDLVLEPDAISGPLRDEFREPYTVEAIERNGVITLTSGATDEDLKIIFCPAYWIAIKVL